MLVVLVLSVVSMLAVRIVGGSSVGCLVWLAVTALMVVVSAVLTKWHGSH